MTIRQRDGGASVESSRRDSAFRRGPVLGLSLGVVGIVALFVVRFVSGDLELIELPNVVADLLTLSISVILESLQFVILGILLSILVQFWIPDAWVMRIMPTTPWLRRIVISFLGMFLPVCECGNVPLSRGLVRRGFSVSESMTFLVAAPILNPITIITTHQAFGFDDGILVARLLGGFLIANVIGWLFSKHPDPASLLTSRFAASCEVQEPHDHPHSRLQQSISLFVREAGVIMPALFLGSLVAGLVQVAVPREVLVSLGSNPVWSVLAMMLLAFVVSICSNIDAFFILPFASTFMPGAIVAFLLFGPIIDIKMLALMRTTFTTAVLVRMTVVVALMTVAISLAVNYVF